MRLQWPWTEHIDKTDNEKSSELIGNLRALYYSSYVNLQLCSENKLPHLLSFVQIRLKVCDAPSFSMQPST